MTRAFAFGCSFTQYWRWPTWADMIGRQYDFFENWGLCGAGNCYILYSLIECQQRHNLGINDKVYIMWSNTSREDRYIDGRWMEGGNVYWDGHPLGHQYRRRFACERGYLIRDLAVIQASKQLLEAWQCDWKFFSMVPLDRSNFDNQLGANPDMKQQDNQDVIDLYRSTLDCIENSVLDVVFNGNWFTGTGIPDVNDGNRRDFHPTPCEHVDYIQKTAPDMIIDTDVVHWMQQWNQKIVSGEQRWRPTNIPIVRL